jgi:hypothetical protein
LLLGMSSDIMFLQTKCSFEQDGADLALKLSIFFRMLDVLFLFSRMN